MRSFSSFLLSLVVAGGLLFAAGCDSTGADGESGTLELRMNGSTSKALTKSVTTHSGPPTADSIEKALVTIGEVSIVPAEKADQGDSTDTGVKVLSDTEFEVDLKNLQAGVDTALAEVEIPTGTYSQVRFITTEKVQVTFKGDSNPTGVKIASGQQTGLKATFDPFTIESADDRVEVTINWDVEEALKGNPNGKYVITPAIQATVDTTSIGN
ncbi:hypothetical protein BSZ35_14010 [Salinibacter sp. 10B]|uniref:DUF4382 domain-containing protein n=1 Tax=Salinibacter sp. 10B TaxID=1923971 RepID=UPI000CF411BF|nr:DUF4382 domain-containing protein [Salinibacter sp. 10B]PQJ35568.1 hypothetical protein BSZ35_14010 [Salinibacter sp. 10B]